MLYEIWFYGAELADIAKNIQCRDVKSDQKKLVINKKKNG